MSTTTVIHTRFPAAEVLGKHCVGGALVINSDELESWLRERHGLFHDWVENDPILDRVVEISSRESGPGSEPVDLLLDKDEARQFADRVLRSGLGRAYCDECQQAFAATDLVVNDDEGLRGLNMKRLKCPNGHFLAYSAGDYYVYANNADEPFSDSRLWPDE